MDMEEFRQSWSAVFLPDVILSEELLARLKRRYPLILLSNTNEAHIEFIEQRYRVLKYFDEKVLSHEVGALKPDPKIFQAAIALSGKPAERLFFTDDLPQNIDGARRSGINARQFVSESNLIEDLRAFGVDV
jgi:putative hydrolase of the HAD superfamily